MQLQVFCFFSSKFFDVKNTFLRKKKNKPHMVNVLFVIPVIDCIPLTMTSRPRQKPSFKVEQVWLLGPEQTSLFPVLV